MDPRPPNDLTDKPVAGAADYLTGLTQDGCTGHLHVVDGPDMGARHIVIVHDGDTCPVHETGKALHAPTDQSGRSYEDAIEGARECLRETLRDPREGHAEYTRGVVNLIAELFGVWAQPTSERMDDVAEDIGLDRATLPWPR